MVSVCRLSQVPQPSRAMSFQQSSPDALRSAVRRRSKLPARIEVRSLSESSGLICIREALDAPLSALLAEDLFGGYFFSEGESGDENDCDFTGP